MGKIYEILGEISEGIFTFLIFVVRLIMNIAGSMRQILSIFSIFFILILIQPLFLILLLRNRAFVVIMLFVLLTPWIGAIFLESFNKLKYITSQYFYDKSDFYIKGVDNRKGSISDYSNYYEMKKQEKIRAEEERRRREYERRAREQQRIWEELFRQYYNQTGSGYSSQFNQERNYRNTGGNVYNPTSDFIEKYNNSCKELGIEPTDDENKIKQAYRELAKKYHPDINKEPGSTEKFQRINEANEFLSGSNIERYRSIRNQ